ncbi:sensor histidine kinase [Streptomyces sp. enrichment culture]|uniref:sensor histidine kinase n=1 Tax=Streptomyces sp. enrichment culture TaxID=1795815 RepID=UPI003F570FA0
MTQTRRTYVADGISALGLLGVGLAGTAFADTPGRRPADAVALGLVALAALVLAVRRLRPLFVLAVTAASTSAYLLLGYTYGPILACFFVAVYTVARHLPPRTAGRAAALVFAVLLAHVFRESSPDRLWLGVVPAAAWVAVPYAVGTAVRLARQSRAQARAEVLREQVHDERMRVAQEVHDVVGHGLAAIKMQADVALHVLSKRPEQAETALRTISTTSAAALEELRATLYSVRHRQESRTATSGLDRLPGLVERMAHAGLQVKVVTDGEPRTLPAAVDLAAYRIVQESVTNVLRHAGTSTATVRVDYGADVVTVQVTNPGERVRVHPGEGTGIAGMRERVAALGGTFTAQPDPDGGYRVRATIPTGSRP